MPRQSKFPQEVRERAVRMVFELRAAYDSQWAAGDVTDAYTGIGEPVEGVWGCGPRRQTPRSHSLVNSPNALTANRSACNHYG